MVNRSQGLDITAERDEYFVGRMKKGRSDPCDSDGLFQVAVGLDNCQRGYVSQAFLRLSLCCFLKAAGLRRFDLGAHSLSPESISN